MKDLRIARGLAASLGREEMDLGADDSAPRMLEGKGDRGYVGFPRVGRWKFEWGARGWVL